MIKKFVLMLFILSYSLLYSKDLEFVSIENLIEQEIGRIVLPQIFKEAGLYLSISPEPGIRAKVMTERGEADGEIMRVYNYGLDTRNVVRVPTPYYHLETMPFVCEKKN